MLSDTVVLRYNFFMSCFPKIPQDARSNWRLIRAIQYFTLIINHPLSVFHNYINQRTFLREFLQLACAGSKAGTAMLSGWAAFHGENSVAAYLSGETNPTLPATHSSQWYGYVAVLVLIHFNGTFFLQHNSRSSRAVLMANYQDGDLLKKTGLKANLRHPFVFLNTIIAMTFLVIPAYGGLNGLVFGFAPDNEHTRAVQPVGSVFIGIIGLISRLYVTLDYQSLAIGKNYEHITSQSCGIVFGTLVMGAFLALANSPLMFMGTYYSGQHWFNETGAFAFAIASVVFNFSHYMFTRGDKMLTTANTKEGLTKKAFCCLTTDSYDELKKQPAEEKPLVGALRPASRPPTGPPKKGSDDPFETPPEVNHAPWISYNSCFKSFTVFLDIFSVIIVTTQNTIVSFRETDMPLSARFYLGALVFTPLLLYLNTFPFSIVEMFKKTNSGKSTRCGIRFSCRARRVLPQAPAEVAFDDDPKLKT